MPAGQIIDLSIEDAAALLNCGRAELVDQRDAKRFRSVSATWCDAPEAWQGKKPGTWAQAW
jgi:hypothetical protein